MGELPAFQDNQETRFCHDFAVNPVAETSWHDPKTVRLGNHRGDDHVLRAVDSRTNRALY